MSEIPAEQPGVTEQQFACAYGSEDPNDAHLMCIDIEGCAAEEMTHWIRDSYVAVRTVTYGPWRRFVPPDYEAEPPF